ncbi:MAG: NitT/TauT family transport system ATP-binding protein [Oceanospirillaceae bacterium]
MELKAVHVSHHYQQLQVLDDINLDIGEGKIVALVGPSGCGKSTLLNILGGLMEPSEGQVLQAGDLPDGCVNALTYVFQDFSLLPWLSVYDNIALVLENANLNIPQTKQRVAEALSRTGLSDFINALPKQLSGGMRQRVGIARALAVNPAVLLMDEPLSALDAQTRELLMEDIVQLWLKDKITAVYVTHNLSEAVRIAHQVVVLSRRPGRIKDIIEINRPLEDRLEHPQEMAQFQQQIWSLIKDEAIEAEREVVNVD